MAVTSPVSTPYLLDTCRDFYKKYGFLNYAAIGRIVGLSRERVRQRLTEAVEKQELDAELFERYRNSSSATANVTMKLRVLPETRDFIQNTAQAFNVLPATVVEAAVACYRKQIEDAAFQQR